MSTFGNPLEYIGVRARFPAEQYLKQQRDPTTTDSHNFVIGDEWRNTNTNEFWKLVDIDGAIADWRKMTVGPGTLLEITAGDGTIVFPDGNSNITFVDGNGVDSVGGVNQITFNMHSPFTGNFTFQSTTPGITEVVTITNITNAAGSQAEAAIMVAGLLAGDAWVKEGVNGGPSYAQGINTQTLNHPWKLTYDGTGNASPSSATIGADWDPIAGTMTFPENVQAISYALPDLLTSGYGKIIATSSIVVSADGVLTIISGSKLTGIGVLSFEATGRRQKIVFSVSGSFGAASLCYAELSDDALNAQIVFSNFVTASDGVSSIALQCNIGNRNGGTGPVILTWYGDPSAPIDVNMELLPSSFVVASYLDMGGYTMSPAVNNPGSYIMDSTNNNTSSSFSLLHSLIPGTIAANNIGVSLDFGYQLSGGGFAIGNRIKSIGLTAGTNLQDSQFIVQTNNSGFLFDTLRIDNFGQATHLLATPFPVGYYPYNLKLDNATATNNIYIQPYEIIGGTDRFPFGFGAHTQDGINLITDTDGANNGANGILGWIEGIMSLYGISSTGPGNQTIPISSLKSVDIDPQGFCYAYKFVTKSVTTFPIPTLPVPPADTFWFHVGAGGASNDYFTMDLSSTSGFGGFQFLNVGAPAQNWQIQLNGTNNSFNIEYQNATILGVTASNTLEFFGTTSNPAPNITAQAQVTTIDATVTTIYTISLGINQSCEAFARIQGKKSDLSAVLFGNIEASARRAAGAAIVVGTPIINFDTDSGGTPFLFTSVSGNNLIIQVRGVAAQTWNWLITIDYAVFT